MRRALPDSPVSLTAPRARLPRRGLRTSMIALLASTCLAAPAFAETWLANPGSSDFNTAANWDPASVPLAVAVFGNSTITTLTFSGSRNLDAFQFNAGAPAYTFDLTAGFGVRFNGNGIVNNSSNAPTFNVDSSILEFDSAASAGNAIINLVNGTVSFLASGTPGAAQLNAATGTVFDFSATTGPANNNIISAGSIAGAGNFVLGANQLNVGSNNLSTTVSGTISGNALVKEGTGTLTLSGTNTYTGGTTITDGTIAAASQTAGVVDALGSGAVTLDGGKLRVDVTADFTNLITFNAGKTSTLSTATGQTVTLTNATTVTLGANAIANFGAATDTGTIIYGAGATVDPTASIVVAGGKLQDSGDSLVGLTFAAASTTVNAGAVLDFNDSSNQAIHNLQGSGSVVTGTVGGTTLSLYVDPSASSTFGGTISGPGRVLVQTLAGIDGTMIFTGANTYTGGTDICACTTLQLGTLLAAGSIVGNVHNEGVFNIVNSNTSGIAKINNVFGGATNFFNTTTASAIEINNIDGTTAFHNNSSAGTANITNRDFGVTIFNNDSTAANATITNRVFGAADFNNNSTAANANITNNGGVTSFFDNATAGAATITNRNGGGTTFSDNSKAGTANITNRDFSGTAFELDSSADHATITNNGGVTIFLDRATAGFATIVNRNGGGTLFNNDTTADNATITTRAGSITLFVDNSTGGNARFITELGGEVDWSGTTGPGGSHRVSAGSIEGAGTYYIGAGNTLSVGSNGLSTEVSGVIADFCGCTPPGPGTLEKVGAGTLILSGTNTYTGGTIISAGVLQLGNGGASGSIVGNVLNNATLAFNRSDVFTFSGVISGVGVVQQNGTGTTVFTGANTYTGGTIVNAGTLAARRGRQSCADRRPDGQSRRRVRPQRPHPDGQRLLRRRQRAARRRRVHGGSRRQHHLLGRDVGNRQLHQGRPRHDDVLRYQHLYGRDDGRCRHLAGERLDRDVERADRECRRDCRRQRHAADHHDRRHALARQLDRDDHGRRQPHLPRRGQLLRRSVAHGRRPHQCERHRDLERHRARRVRTRHLHAAVLHNPLGGGRAQRHVRKP